MLDWIHQTLAGVRPVPIEAPRFAHPVLAERLSLARPLSETAGARSRKRLEARPKSEDELYLAARAAGGTAAFEDRDGESAAVAF